MREEMKTYRVVWEIDVDATSPRDAAEKAWELMRFPDSRASIFYVSQLSRAVIDLLWAVKKASQFIDLSEGVE